MSADLRQGIGIISFRKFSKFHLFNDYNTSKSQVIWKKNSFIKFLF